MKLKRKNIRIPGSFLAVLWAVVLVVVYFALVSAVQLKQEWKVKETMITFTNGYDQQHMLVSTDIENILIEYFGSNLEGVPVKHVETDLIEDLIQTSDYIKGSEVYVDKRNRMHIEVEERVPVWRVIKGNASHYIDIDGMEMPLSKNFTARVPVLIDEYPDDGMYAVSKGLIVWEAIRGSTFFRALIDQLVIKKNGHISARPLIGDEEIEFGSMENLDEQLEKYAAFYRQYMAEEGWNKYERVNLTIPGQVRPFRKT
jgi:cell division protein FtsQ